MIAVLMKPGFLVILGLIAAACALTVAAVAEAKPYLGPAALLVSGDGQTLYVANRDGRGIACVDPVAGKVSRQIAVPGKPTGLALSPDGRMLIATCAAPNSIICLIDSDSGETVRRIHAGHTAMGPAVGPDGKRLYVCNCFDHDVSVIDLAAGKETTRVAAIREPVAAAVTPDGRSVLVINHLPADRANSFYVAAEVTVIDTATNQTTTIRLPNGSTSVRGLCLSADGRLALVTHVLSNYELVPSQVEAGWTNTNVVSVIDTSEKKFVNTVALDDMYLGAANPWAVACTDDGRWICVAHAGTHELSVIDAPGLLARLGITAGPETLAGQGPRGLYASPTVNGIPSGMGILDGLRRRIQLAGKGPRGLAVAGSNVYVADYFSDALEVIDLRAETSRRPNDSGTVPIFAERKWDGPPRKPKTIALGPTPRADLRRRGEMLFHDATICYQHWQSCASCHPDARSDVLNWDLRNDGVGNPKNTKSMLLAHRTPPAMATGIRPTAEAAVRAGIRHTLFTEQPESVAVAIDAYLRGLRPVPSPRLEHGRLSPAARRGKKLFQSDAIACHRCHPAPTYTDRQLHDVGTRAPYDVARCFDTPTLIEVWRTAPYLHDGRYTTIEELIVKGRHGLEGGRFEKLTRQQIKDLVEFVLSL